VSNDDKSPAATRGFSLPASQAGDGFYLRPLGFLSGAVADAAIARGAARRLGGGALAFTACEAALRRPADGSGDAVARCVFDLQALDDWARGQGDHAVALVTARLDALGAARPSFAGLTLAQPCIMGVVNVTPDSFSDGGDFADPAHAIAEGLAMREAGADILDIGGESTRPGAAPVTREEELARVVPVVRALAERGAVVSIDTRHAAVMRAAIAAGARIVNDVTALTGDPDSLATVAASGAGLVLMHMQGEPQTMQQDPHYDDAPLDVYDYLRARVAAALAAGIARERIAIDPGIGFGKNDAHNVAILGSLGLYHGAGCAVLLGVSRKSFVGRLSAGEPPKGRLPGSLAAALGGLDQGVQILRVHDVAETVQARAIWHAITTSGR
jgi:dihydropteroate synthase